MRKSLAFYLCLFLILAGCSKTETATSPSPQALNPAGIYTLNYTEQSGGTCGSVPSTYNTVTITSTSTKFTWTQNNTTVDAGSQLCSDKCTTTVTATVSESDAQTGLSLTGPLAHNVTITSTGMTGTATFTGTMKDIQGATIGTCSSTYTVTGTKK